MTIEPGPDNTVIVSGVSIDEVRARLIRRPVGRPRKEPPTITSGDIAAAVADLRVRDFPLTERFLADMVGCSQRDLRKAIRMNFGSWRVMRRDAAL